MLLTALSPLLYIAALGAFLLLAFGLRRKGRCLGWLLGLVCLAAFLMLMGVLH